MIGKHMFHSFHTHLHTHAMSHFIYFGIAKCIAWNANDRIIILLFHSLHFLHFLISLNFLHFCRWSLWEEHDCVPTTTNDDYIFDSWNNNVPFRYHLLQVSDIEWIWIVFEITNIWQFYHNSVMMHTATSQLVKIQTVQRRHCLFIIHIVDMKHGVL